MFIYLKLLKSKPVHTALVIQPLSFVFSSHMDSCNVGLVIHSVGCYSSDIVRRGGLSYLSCQRTLAGPRARSGEPLGERLYVIT